MSKRQYLSHLAFQSCQAISIKCWRRRKWDSSAKEKVRVEEQRRGYNKKSSLLVKGVLMLSHPGSEKEDRRRKKQSKFVIRVKQQIEELQWEKRGRKRKVEINRSQKRSPVSIKQKNV